LRSRPRELRANVKSISHKCNLEEVAIVWELTQETIRLPLGCLQGGKDLGVSESGAMHRGLVRARLHCVPLRPASVCMCVRVRVCVCVYVCVRERETHRERERERENERETERERERDREIET